GRQPQGWPATKSGDTAGSASVPETDLVGGRANGKNGGFSTGIHAGGRRKTRVFPVKPTQQTGTNRIEQRIGGPTSPWCGRAVSHGDPAECFAVAGEAPLGVGALPNKGSSFA